MNTNKYQIVPKSLTDRQNKILKYIVENYIKNGEPIASLFLKEKVLYSISSATIRNELVVLEKGGLLFKEHSSSGRVPTSFGYEYYANHLMDSKKDNEFKKIHDAIKRIFAKRHNSIDTTIDETVKLLEKFVKLPIVITKITNEKELLRRIDIVNITNNQFMLFLITSYSNVIKYNLEIKNQTQIDDIAICLRIFNEKLAGTPIYKIIDKIQYLTELIRSQVHEYEFVFNQILMAIINKIQENLNVHKSKVYNTKSLANHPEIIKNNISLKKIFSLLDSSSVFSQLNFNFQKTGKTLINFENSVEGISIAATEFQDESGVKHQIGFLGPTRMNYKLINQILEYLNEKLSPKKILKKINKNVTKKT